MSSFMRRKRELAFARKEYKLARERAAGVTALSSIEDQLLEIEEEQAFWYVEHLLWLERNHKNGKENQS